MHVSMGMVRGLVAELEAEGVARERVLASGGVDAALLAHPTTALPLDDYVRFVRAAEALAPSPGLGLRAGERTPPEAGAMLKIALLSAPTLRDAFELGRTYAPLYVEGARWTFEEDGDDARVGYEHDAVPPDVERVEAELVMAFTLACVVRRFLGREGRPRRLSFRHAAPPWVDEYDRLFRGALCFDAPTNEAVFDRASLDAGQIHADATLFDAARVEVERLLRARLAEDDLVGRVTDLLRRRVAGGADDADAGVEAIARKLGVSVRTLRRQLHAKGTSARGLFETVRREAAEAALRGAERSLAEVATDLGFSEPSAFYRAFKRWTGLTPQQYRERARGDS